MRRLLMLIWLGAAATQPAADVKAPAHVTSQACKGCHEAAYAAWADSHHSWAWREPTPENLLGDFDQDRLEHKGFVYRFETEDDRFFVVADDEAGKARRYPVRYVVGVTPLQQYLLDTGRGRLQTLDVSWDTERKRWFHLYPDVDTSAGNGMHWTGPYKNWNARCAECHATDYRKNYDPRTDSYRSAQAEIGVGCEACHGPGEAHLAWARQPDGFDAGQWSGVDALGLTPVYRPADAASQINLCATCHARRGPIGADSPPPGAEFHDHYRLALLRDGLYFPDGQVDDEVYVYGSFLQSKMHAAGVGCGDCHDSHSARLRLRGDATCTQCHNPGGNPRFPTLPKALYDAPEHHFHAPGTEGAACVSCHMPDRNYMVVDPRRDHGFRVPRPDLAVGLGIPEPCTVCHQDRDAAWAAGEIAKRSSSGRAAETHFAVSFAAADRGDDSAAAALRGIAGNAKLAPIVRASAIDRLGRLGTELEPDAVRAWLADESPLIRGAAIPLTRGLPEPRRLASLTPLLRDRARSVRIEAAKRFLGVSGASLDDQAKLDLREAMGELQRSLAAKADYPEVQLAIGGVALALRNLQAAARAFERAVQMDPQLVDGWLMLARIHVAGGDEEAGRAALARGLDANPGSAELRQESGYLSR